jgi:hypothetical protein
MAEAPPPELISGKRPVFRCLMRLDEALRLGLARFGKLGDERVNLVETPGEILHVGRQGGDGCLIGIRAVPLNTARLDAIPLSAPLAASRAN